MSNNQDPNQQHIMYQQQSYAAYPSANSTMGTWGQPQPQQAVPYAYSPYQADVNTFNEKSAYGSTYPVQYGGGDSDYYRSSYYNHPQQTHSNQQWQQGTYPGYNSPMYSCSSYPDREQARNTTFNPGAPPPNMSRPPPNIKRENGDNTFHASLSILENPAQTAAAYTASWVSSTSSIPPELKDEPEFPGDLGGNMFSAQNFTDQFSGLSLAEPQKDENNRNKSKDRDRRPREEPQRELTWEERVRKAAHQKERIEQRGGAERGNAVSERERPEREIGGAPSGGTRGGPRLRGSGGPPRQRDGRDRGPRPMNTAINSGMMWKNNDNGDHRMGGDHDAGNHNRSNYNRPGSAGQMPGGGMGHPMAAQMPVFTGQPQQMMMRNTRNTANTGYCMRPQMPAQPPHMMNLQQDERFKNTWLDANAFVQPFPLPFPPMPYGMEGGRMRGRGRGGGRGGINRGNYNNRRDNRRDYDRREDANGEEKSSPTDDCVVPLVPAPEELPPASLEPQPSA